MIAALVLLPALAGVAAFMIRRADSRRRALLVGTAALHALLTMASWARPPRAILSGWLQLDDLGLLFLGITTALFLAASIYAVGYFRREARGSRADFEEGFLFTDAPEATFTGCLLFFLASMTLVTVSHHFGLLWIAIEATTLASAPLIYYHRHHRSLEATWKYLMICSVGIALALLGNFFLTVAMPVRHGHAPTLLLDDLLARSRDFDPAWFRAAFLFLLVGYGTKMGLAPLHTWLPDAHSEAPSLVSALLSGALLNCAFLGVLRIDEVAAAAGQGAFAGRLLIGFGLLSMAVAGIFIVGQRDMKRLLAYSSIEHMGILSLGVGLGGMAAFGAMLHAVNHSLTKAMLFLVSGNIVTAYRSKAIADVRGMVSSMPSSGVLWIAGFFAIAGSPPFGLFQSEFAILRAALDGGHGWIAFAYLALLGLAFVGLASAMLGMAQGEHDPARELAAGAESPATLVPPIVLACAILLLGLHLPSSLRGVLEGAARRLGGS